MFTSSIVSKPLQHAPSPPTSPVDDSVHKARAYLLSIQKPDGHWCGELEGDTILESEYILLMAFLGRENEPKVRKAAEYIFRKQRPEGAWSNYPGGPVDVSVSVKAYFALKLAGFDTQHRDMVRARTLIREAGGAACVNSFTKFYLAFLGQIPYDSCPSVPAEMVLLPRWSYINIFAMSSWTRTIVVPLSIFSAYKPVRTLPPELGIRELFLQSPEKRHPNTSQTRRLFTWSNFFHAADGLIKLYERFAPQGLRRRAVRAATRWMLEHFEDSDGVGAIFPPIIYTIICLKCLKYPDDSREMRYALKQLDDLMIEDEETLRVQPCFSPVWDTALSVNALAMAGTNGHDASMLKAVRWLLSKEVQRRGDWTLSNPGIEPAGWFFEYRNGFYPDMDDTAMVLSGLARSGAGMAYEPADRPTTHGKTTWHPAVQRGVRWLLAMQNDDGGWAAFDRNINKEILTKVPFADHNAMLDPSCPDITARVLEALGQYRHGTSHPQVAKALAFLEKTQDARGCWIGRWGVNYIYGTWQVLQGLEAVGIDRDLPMIRRACEWLKSVQQADGGWGESCRSYDDPSTAGQGPTTASQTAWAILGLIAAGEADSISVRRGIQFLVERQQSDGNWHEEEFTGTGFPKVFYLRYHLYRLYFPLMALARFRTALQGKANVNYKWSAESSAE